MVPETLRPETFQQETDRVELKGYRERRAVRDRLERRFPLIVAVAIALHLIWAMGLLIDPRSHFATAVHAMMLVTDNTNVAALVLFTVAAMAWLGIKWHRDTRYASGRVIKTLLFLPQQCVLIMSATGAASAILASSFADGIIRPMWFIAVDQMPVILIMVGNFLAITYFAREYE